MKKRFVFPICVLASFQAHAIVNGTPLNWQNNDATVRLDSQSLGLNGQCTGTIISGRYVLTAAHCLANRTDTEQVLNAYGHTQAFNWDNKIVHTAFTPTSDGFTGEDVALIPLTTPVDYKNIQFIENLTTYTPSDVAVTISGFGQTHTLSRADFMIDTSKTRPHIPYKLYANQENNSHTIGGDSGSAWIANNRIIGVHQGSDTTSTGTGDDIVNTRETYATNLKTSSNLILENIDAWHYPTVANVTGAKTIEIQSLHQNNVDLLNKLHFFGDVDVETTSGTCVTDRTISPFEICTLEVTSNGGEGTIVLADGQEIQINKQISVVGGNDSSSNGGGSSGASMGFFSMLAMFGLGVYRMRQRK